MKHQENTKNSIFVYNIAENWLNSQLNKQTQFWS
jgi:hypothetical protein